VDMPAALSPPHAHTSHVLLPRLTPKLLHTGRTPTLWRVF
jgi:hypothetical protein